MHKDRKDAWKESLGVLGKRGNGIFFSNSPGLPSLKSLFMEVILAENIISGHSSVSSGTNNMQATVFTLSLAEGVHKTEIE